MSQARELIDWDLAIRVGRRVAGGDEVPAQAAWAEQLTRVSARADEAVAEYTGLGAGLPPPTARALDRGQWVEANLGTLRRVLRPVTEKVAGRKAWTAPGPVPAAMRRGTQAATGAQAGALLGYVGQRVLGQYDLPVAPAAAAAVPAVRPNGAATGNGPAPGNGTPPQAVGTPPADGPVWYVVPNIVGIERRFGFDAGDFRLWIALHETAHRRQFGGVPWLAGHITGLLEEYLGSVDLDEEAVRKILRRAEQVARQGLRGERIEVLDFLVTPEQKHIVQRMQAVMSVLEGHGELVMDALGKDLVPGHDRMRATLHERRNNPGRGDRVLQQVLGLRGKLDQYEQGERFLLRLQQRGGMAAVNGVFAEPAALPTLEEVRDPDRYLARAG